MRVLLLSDINSIHTRRWARSLHDRGVEIAVFSFTRLIGDPGTYSGITVFSHGIPDKNREGLPFSGKLKYFSSLSYLKRCIRSFKPDILHAHYASNYGTLGALSGFHPFILSVWGSDIYRFPVSSGWKRSLISHNLRKADRVLSTSHAMAAETSLYIEKKIGITPFGIDLSKFRSFTVDRQFPEGTIVIGTTKSLEKIYGIDLLIDLFPKLRTRHPDISLKLLICSSGSQEASLREQVASLGLENDIVFRGTLSHDEIPEWLNRMDIYAALSHSESFGVAVIEASACGIPVVVSDVGGLKEVVADGITGFRVTPGDPEEALAAFGKLITDPALRKSMGREGREWVSSRYDWTENVSKMVEIYHDLLARRRS